MEDAVRSRTFVLREVAPVVFLNDIISNKEWLVEIDESVNSVTVNGIPSEQVQYNQLLRTLVWTNFSAEGSGIKSGALSFDSTFTGCHGRVTNSSDLSYLVESAATSDKDANGPTLQNTELSVPPAYYAHEASDGLVVEDVKLESDGSSDSVIAAPLVLVEDSQLQLKQMALDVITQASEEVGVASLNPELMATMSAQVVGDVSQKTEGMTSKVVDDSKAFADDQSLLESVSTTEAQIVLYTTRKRPKGSTDEKAWEYFATFGVGAERQTMLHQVILLGDIDITHFVVINGDEKDNFVKEADIASQPDQWGFDITFTGSGRSKSFISKLYKDGKEYEWKGGSPNLGTIPRKGTNQPVKGSDGLALDNLLYNITSLARAGDGSEPVAPAKEDADNSKTVDLAQKEADITLGRLMMASVDSDISDMLFKNIFVLTPAEKEIQKKGTEFLKRCGIHHVLKMIKQAEKVKQSIKDKINSDKCDRFMPMCLAPVAPADVAKDPVVLYGLDRKKAKDKQIIDQLQNEAREVQQACYIAGYRTAVLGIQPYLNNAGEWYNLLDTTLQDKIFLQDWENKAAASGGVSKTMHNLKLILDVLWQVTQESDAFKNKLKRDVKTPEEIHAVLNGAAFKKAQELLAWDDNLRAHVKEVFTKLDQTQKDKRAQELADRLKTQMIVDDSKRGSFQALGEDLMSFMERCRGSAKWTARDAQDALALAHAGQAQGIANAIPDDLANRARVEKKIQVKERWFSGARAIVTAASIGLLTYVLSNKAAQMEWYETLSIAGELCQGFATLHSELSALGSALKAAYQTGFTEKAQKVKAFFADTARWIYDYVLAPVAKFAVAIGTWLYQAVGRIGEALISGIRSFAGAVANGIKSGLIKAYNATIGRAVTFLQDLPIAWGKVFGAITNALSFGISVLCLGIAIRDCIAAWKDGRPIDKATSTISAVIVGLEVIVMVVQGIAWLVDAGAVVAACSSIAMVLGVVGIVFAVALIIIAFATYEDPIDTLVEKYGKKYDLLY